LGVCRNQDARRQRGARDRARSGRRNIPHQSPTSKPRPR
jgi:hypothetical protein